MDSATQNLHIGEASHRTGRGAVVLFLGRSQVLCVTSIAHRARKLVIAVKVELVRVDTRTATEHITTEQPQRIVKVVSFHERLIGSVIGQTYRTAINDDIGISTHVSILTTTIDRRQDGRSIYCFPIRGIRCAVSIQRRRSCKQHLQILNAHGFSYSVCLAIFVIASLYTLIATTDSHLRLVDIAAEECGTVMIAWRFIDVWSCLTCTAA